MATKAAYLTALASDTGIIKVGTPVQSNTAEQASDTDLTIYKVDMVEHVNGDKVVIRNHTFAVYREGLSGESAVDYRAKRKSAFEANDTVRTAIGNYLDGLTDVRGYHVLDYNREQNWGKAHVHVLSAGEVTEKYYWIERNSGVWEHYEITNVV